jgi:hypothetical protein
MNDLKGSQEKFTVVLRYPEYYTDEFPRDVYADVVSAPSWDKAVSKLQRKLCRQINREAAGQIRDPSDLSLVVAIKGIPTIWT